MSGEQEAAQKSAITAIEMNGRIHELERQRTEALTRCSMLSGSNALLRQALTEAGKVIETLNARVAELTPEMLSTDPAGNQSQAPILN